MSSAPPSRSVPPTIAAPVSPISPASAPPSASPTQPPLSLPSSVIRPRKPTPSPSRNGRTSSSSLRASMSPPTPRSASGQDVRSLPSTSESIREPRSHRASVETQVEDDREHEAERGQREPEELVLAVRAGALRPFLDACGDAWPKRPLPPPARHAPSIRRRAACSCGPTSPRALEPRLRPARRRRDSRSRASPPSPPRDPCRPGRSARSRF